MLKNLVTSFNCGVVKGDTMECRVFSSAEITSTYTLVFFFPMTSAVDQSEIRALKVNSASKWMHKNQLCKYNILFIFNPIVYTEKIHWF